LREALLLSQLLTLHLDLAIKRHRTASMPSKFEELATFTSESLKDWDKQAQELLDNGKKLKAKGDEVFQRHRAKQAEARAGFTAMEDAVRDLSGGNLPNEEEATGSESSSTSFPAKEA
jgi:hypothetical protein